MATKTPNLGLSKAEEKDAIRSTLTANNGNFDKLDTVINELDGESERLLANQIQGTASGMEIVVEDSANMESVLHISGNSEQDSRSGKNLLFLPNNTASFIGATRVVQDGVITINGTTTQYGENVWNSFQVKEDGNYTFSITLNSTISNAWTIFQESSDNSTWTALVTLNLSELTKSETKTLSKNKYYRLRVTADGGVAFSNLTIKPQLEKGTEATEWEPYGAMPSPDYPAEIRSVKSKSDNLFDKTMSVSQSAYISVSSILDTGLRIVMTDANSYGLALFSIKDLTGYVGKTVRMKCNFAPSSTNTPAYKIGLCEANGDNRQDLAASSISGKEISFVVPELTSPKTYLGVWLYPHSGSASATGYADFTNIMVNIGDKALPYQPYGYVPVEAKVEGKNLVDTINGGSTNNGITYEVQENGTIIANGTSTGVANWFSRSSKQLQTLPKGTYTFFAGAKNYIEGIQMKVLFEGGEFASGKNPYTFTVENEFKCRISLRIPSGVTLNNYIFYPMIVRGEYTEENFPPYVPYVEPTTISVPLGDIELRSTPDGTRDTFERVDGVWNKVENRPSIIIDGAKGWANFETQIEGYYKAYSTDYKLGLTNSTLATDKFICSHFDKASAFSVFRSEKECLATSKNAVYISISSERASNARELKEWLNNNPIEVVYPLATPTYTPITDPALIKALDELESLILHKGYNHITVTSVNGVKAYLDLSYVKDMQKEIDRIEDKFDEEVENIKAENSKLNDQITRLKANQIQGTASGMEIVVEDSANMESVLHISGNSEQDSRSGKNLLPFADKTFTVGGITFTCKNGEIFANGTSTSEISTTNSAYKTNLSFTLPAGDYTLQSNIDSKVTYNIPIFIRKTSDNSSLGEVNGSATKRLTFSLAEETEVYIGFYLYSQSLSNMNMYLMLEEGTTVTEYEPYGVQPSPDYPSEIRSVKSRTDNLFNINGDVNTRYDGATGNYNTVSGNNLTTTLNQGTSHGFGQRIYVGAGNAITASAKIIEIGEGTYGDNNTVGELTIYNDGISSNRVTLGFRAGQIGNVNSANFTAETDYIYVAFGCYTARASSVTFTDIMVNKGNKALPYQPYEYVPVEAKVEGKNKAIQINASNNTKVVGGVCTQLIADTKTSLEWKLQAMLNGTYVSDIGNMYNNTLGIRSLQFSKNSSFNRIRLGLNGSSIDTLVMINVAHLVNGETYTIQWNVLNATQGTISWNNVQIEEGTVATVYQPYVEPNIVSLPLGDIELRSTPDGTRDTFKRVDGVWNKVSDTNIEPVSIRSIVTLNNGNIGGLFYSSVKKGTSNIDNILCNIAKTDGRTLKEGTMYENPANIILIGNSTDTLETMKAKYDGAEMLYKLDTPTYTPITDPALISALDELEQLILHKGYNRITVTGINGVKAYLDLNYVKDINIVLDNINAKLGGV